MIFYKSFQICELKDAKVGDLVKISWGHSNTNIGFIYLKAEDYTHVIVLIGSDEIGVTPYSDNFRHDSVCVNYGSDWVIEPINGEQDGISFLSSDPGTIGFTPNEILLSLGARRQGSRTKTQILNLQSFEFHAGRPDHAYNARAWKVWANEGHRAERGGSPLFTFEVKPIAPR